MANQRLSVAQIGRAYGIPDAVVRGIARGKIATAGQASPREAVEELETWRQLLIDPIGVFREPAGPPEDAAEAELDVDGAPERLDAVRREKLGARRRDRVIRGDPEADIPAERALDGIIG